MIVVDASVAVELVLQTRRAAAIGARLFTDSETLHAPHLVDVEVTQALRRLLIARHLSGGRAAEALQDFSQLAIERHSHRPFVPRIWALRESLSAYDAVYVALAEGLKAPLLTCDARLAHAAGHDVQIELIKLT